MAARLHPLFEGAFGYADALHRVDPAAARARDAALDAALDGAGYPAWHAARLAAAPKRAVLLVITARPTPFQPIVPLAESLGRARHHVEVVMDTRHDVWRLTKVNAALAARVAPFDWLVIADEDIAVGPAFLDRFLVAAEAAGLVLAQPAHRIHSYASYAVTQRVERSVVRRTAFVEVGPLLAIHGSILPNVAPFPETRWGWGVDFLWSDAARREGWRIGVVDAAPLAHLRPMGVAYGDTDPVGEANALLWEGAPAIGRQEMLGPGAIVIGW